MTPAGTDISNLRQHLPAPTQQQALPVAAGEMAASAIAAQARATVLARYEMAIRQPRNYEQSRQDLMKECRRPSFAHNKSALYKKPIGEGVEGLGIRFVEVAMRCFKNVLIESVAVFEDDLKEIHRVTVTDLESNTTYPMDVKVSKTVERKKPNDDGTYISMRKNSYGKDVYTVQASDDDLLNKRQAMISKAIRTLGLRVIPGDWQDEAEQIIREIRKDTAAKDPDSEKRKIIDAFGEIGVTAEMLVEYLGHPLDHVQPKELVDLRAYYGAIKDEETTWQAIMEHRREGGGAPAQAKTAEELQRNVGGGTSKQQAPSGGAAAGAAAASEKGSEKKSAPPQQQPEKSITKPTTFNVVTERGAPVTQLAYEPKLGEKVEGGGFPYRVIEVVGDRVTVRTWTDEPQKHPAPGRADEVVTVSGLLKDIMNADTEEQVDEALELKDKVPAESREAIEETAQMRKGQLRKGKPAVEPKKAAAPAAAAKRGGIE